MTEEVKAEVKVEEKKQEDWMTKKWRPMMAMMYMTCCLFDFALFPIMFTVVQFWEVQATNDAFRQWVPITLQGGGLFHVAMGAVLGVSAYGRTQEKVAGATQVGTNPGYGIPSQPQNYQQPVSYRPVSQQPQRVEPMFDAPPVNIGYGGKMAPPPAPEPLI